ncbi:EamA family transporter [Bosea sp. 124]|uniref:DMT family transporter n=1 Tax=Bosea sp. 124 TaxID=2135642 RepID=UPI000D3373FF|nr:EamA family transporter [Bosea sp. 124]PTM41853.1 EamA-like transporter family protein [Bosea sp. 124]
MSRNALFFAVMCLVWGLTFLPVKIAAVHVPPVFLACVRFVFAGAALLAWAGRDAFRVPVRVWPRLAGTSLLVNAGGYSLVFWGVAHAPTGLAAIVNMATIPIYSLLASRVIEGQPIGRSQVAAIALGTAGLGFLFATRAAGGLDVTKGDPLELWGLASVAFGTLLYCVGAVLTRTIATTMPTLTLAAWQTLFGAVALAGVSFAIEPVGVQQIAAVFQWPVLPAVLFLVVAGSLMGFTIYLRLLRDWGAFRAGLYAFVSPVIAVGVGVAVLNEPFGWAEGAGALMMFGAAAIALRR